MLPFNLLFQWNSKLLQMEESRYPKAVRRGKEKEGDPGDSGAIYEAGMNNSAKTMEWRRWNLN